MKLERKIQHNILISLLLILVFSATSFGQTRKSDDESVIPANVKKQIVRKVLTYYFKPTNGKKTIYLSSEGIQQSWLPRIKGFEFRLFDASQFPYAHYLLEEKPFQKENTIGFRYGSGSSGFKGDIWHFSISKQTVKIWKNRNDWYGSSGDDYGSDPNILPPPPIAEPPPPFTQKKKIQ